MKHKPYETTFTKQIAELKPTNAIEYRLLLDIALMLAQKLNTQWGNLLNDKNNTN